MLNQITHSVQEKKIDLVALKESCKAARQMAIEASQFVEDGGPCNLDAIFLYLWKGAKSARVIEAINAGGLLAYKSNWLGNGIMISPPQIGQGNKNSIANEKIYYHLRDRGFQVSIYYQMD